MAHKLTTFNNTFHLSSTMMPKAISVALFLSAILRSDAEKKFAVKENKECVVSDVSKGLFIQLGRDNGRVGKCKEKCILNDQCLAFEFKPPRKCYLFYSEIEKMQKTTDEVYCGRIKDQIIETEPEPEPPVEKEYNIFKYSTCGVIDMKKATNFEDKYQSQEECQTKCNAVKNCKSYQWNGKKNKCTIIKYRIKTENLATVGKKARVCAIVPKPGDTPETEPPVVAPTLPPVAPTLPPVAPTLPPVAPPTDPPISPTLPPVAPTLPPVAPTEPPVPVETVECSLEVVLKYPFDDPDEADYYGYSTEYMVITETGIDDDYYLYECSGSESIYYPEWLPDWCAYENSSEEENVDGATISNLDDYYGYDYLDSLTQETITISNAAGMSFDIDVHKYFYDQDYYTNYAGWEDHMLAAVLTVKNLSSDSQTDLNADGWSKTVDINTPTHIENADGSWSVNENHDDHFKVVVSCDNACLCEGTYFNDD